MKIIQQKVRKKDKIPESLILHKMSLELVHSLSPEEFRKVFQWQKREDLDPEWIIYELAFLKFKIDFNTEILVIKPKKINKLQRFVKFIFKL